ncbi:arylsulfatase B-like [Glandiceps talaboti]
MDGGFRICLVLAIISTSFCKNVKKKPHIIFIVGDDVGWNDVGYHNEIFKTPNIDLLAKSGVKLENYYVGEICAPSRNMLMTGRYTIHTGITSNRFGIHPRSLPLKEVTIGQKLQKSGYSTHIIGKWHCGFYKEQCLPYKRGFDTFFGYLGTSIDYNTHRSKTYKNVYNLRNMTKNEGPKYDGEYATHLFTGEAERLIEQHDPDKPLFLYLAYNSNHAPLAVPEEYEEPLKADIKDEHRLTYAAMASCLDEGVGRVVSKLHSTGLYENSVIVFTSDNGGNPSCGGNNWPLKGSKCTLWEGGVHVPAFVSSPLLKEEVRGTQCKELFHITDWFPTLVHLAKGNLHDVKLDGFNQWKTISEGVPTERQEALINIDELNVMPLPDESRDETVRMYSENKDFNISIYAAIRSGKWKLVTGNAGDVGEATWTPPPEDPKYKQTVATYSAVNLYDIKKDPEERHNLATTHREKVEELLKRLGELFEGGVAPDCIGGNKPRLDYNIMGDLLGPWVK